MNKTNILQQLLKKAGTKGLVIGANIVKEESQHQVPLATGTLMNSCRVTEVNKNLVTVSYNTPYAIKMHEGIGYNFQRDRKAKYLEEPIHSAQVRNNVMKALQAQLGEVIR